MASTCCGSIPSSSVSRPARRSRACRRDDPAWRSSIDDIVAAARSEANLVPPIVRAVESYATLGEISDTLRGVFGEHKEIDA
jgi:methylmalonyl-CoA mutase N-terminal domain/subunit